MPRLLVQSLITSAFLLLAPAVPFATSAAQSIGADSALNACVEHDTTAAWRQISAAWENESGQHWSNDPLRRQLLALGKADQAVRSGPGLSDSLHDSGFIRRMQVRDSLDAAALREIIARYGWPTRSLVGAKGTSAAFLIAQHNDSLQPEALRLMRALPAGEVSRSDLALLEDRVRVNQGKPQLYGSQLKDSKDGKSLVFDPIDDVEHFDARRASVGLQPLPLYICFMHAVSGRDIQDPRPHAVHSNLSPQRRITLNWGVDTTDAITDGWGDYSWHGPVPEILRNWITYLRTDSAGRAALWSPSERKRWPLFDIAGTMSDPGFAAPATITMVQPSPAGATDSYVVKTLYAAADSSRAVRAFFVERVYAVRENGRWVFANALPRLTRDWPHYQIGKGMFVVQPGRAFDAAKAAHTVAFADSLADAYAVPRLPDFTYYVTNSEDDMYRATGVDPMFGAQAAAGRALPSDRIIMSGSPEQGEGYTHEVVHAVFAPLARAPTSSAFASEGVASWLGGSLGADFPTMMHNYAEYLRAHPTITLDSVFAGTGRVDRGQRPAAAMLFDMAHAKGGVPAVKMLLAAPTRSLAEIRSAVTSVLSVPWSSVERQWAANILRH